MSKKITIALGGGGLKGFAHIGVLNQLQKNGYEISAIAGTSAGGIVGGLFAYGYSIDEIISFIDDLKNTKLFSRRASDPPSLIGLKGLYEFLEEKFRDKDIEDLKIPFAVTAVDLQSGQEIIINSGKIVEAIKATTALPGIFPSIRIKNINLVDGGILDPVPVEVARWLDNSSPVIAVCLSPDEESWTNIEKLQAPSFSPIPPLLVDQLSNLRIGKAMQVFLNSLDIMLAKLANLRLQKEKPDVIIRPDIHQYFIFDDVDPYELIKKGQEAVLREQDIIEKAYKTSQRFSRWIKPSRLPGQLIEEISYQSH